MYLLTEKSLQNQPGKKFLDHFENRRRSWVTNLVCFAVREGAQTPETAIAAVIKKITDRSHSPYCTLDETHKISEILNAIENYPQEALLFALFVIAREALPAGVQDRDKAAAARHYQDEYMGKQAPTAKQLRYLHSLGYKGTSPSNRLEASRLIDALRA